MQTSPRFHTYWITLYTYLIYNLYGIICWILFVGYNKKKNESQSKLKVDTCHKKNIKINIKTSKKIKLPKMVYICI